MQRGNDGVQRAKELDYLAEQIRQEISESGVCNLNKADLELLWLRDVALSDADMRIRVNDFALRYGFSVVIDYGFSGIVFRKSD
jgi:hypothetical protein